MSLSAFTGLPLATLQSLQSSYIAALTAIASNQSYSLNGRSLQRADLDKVTATLGQINAAISIVSGNAASQTYVSYTGL